MKSTMVATRNNNDESPLDFADYMRRHPIVVRL